MYTENLKRYRVRRRQGWREEIAHTIEKDRHILICRKWNLFICRSSNAFIFLQ